MQGVWGQGALGVQLASCLEGGHGSGKLGVGGVRQGEAAIRNLLSLSGRNHAKGQGLREKRRCGQTNWIAGLREILPLTTKQTSLIVVWP